ncbi:hypothetical protein QEN19_000673 [Hanseniaspora menglaensis]
MATDIVVNELTNSFDLLTFDQFKQRLLLDIDILNYKNDDDNDVYDFINRSLKPGNRLYELMDEFKGILLNEMNWDNKLNNNYKVANRAIELNKQLYKISLVYNKFIPNHDIPRFFNFECLLNNFKIKFIYHFNSKESKFDLEIMTTFIKSYLEQNLFKGLRIALNDISNLTFEAATDYFIMEIIKILKSKIHNNINGNNDLIMKIFEFNNFLKHEYGTNSQLYDVIPKQQIQEWIKFEIQLIKEYYNKNFNKTQYNLDDGDNLNKYLLNLFDYFKPFLVLEVDLKTKYILQFKIMIFQKIILQILESYRSGINVNNKAQENNLLPGSFLSLNGGSNNSSGIVMGYSHLNFQKNILFIYDNLLKLSKNQTIIMINRNFNELIKTENEGMYSLLEGEIIEYKRLIIINFNNMVIPFTKKISKDNLAEYIKLDWHDIENKSMYDFQVWPKFLESNNKFMSICSEIFSTSSSNKKSSLEVLLQLQFDKLQTVNNSLIIKAITNNILLAFKMTVNQEIVINILLKDIASLKIEPTMLIEWVKFQHYAKLINLLIYKEMNNDLLKFNKSDDSIMKLQNIYELQTLTVQEIKKVWQIYI